MQKVINKHSLFLQKITKLTDCLNLEWSIIAVFLELTIQLSSNRSRGNTHPIYLAFVCLIFYVNPKSLKGT